MKKPTLFIDMDDTIVKYREAYQLAKNNNPSLEYPQSKEGFFINLEPIDNSIEIIKSLESRFDVWILTRPSYKNPLSYTEKRLWIEKYFGLEFCQKLILCPDKGLIKGDYLIDDYLWSSFCGKQIQYGIDVQNWEEVKEILIKETTKIDCKCPKVWWKLDSKYGCTCLG